MVFPILLYRHLGGSSKRTFGRELKGQVVLITGASSGLGEALAHVFYKAGCKLILASRRVEELDRVKESLLATNQVCRSCTVFFFFGNTIRSGENYSRTLSANTNQRFNFYQH